MPAEKHDRVQETTSTQGTGPYILDGAVTGFRGFGAVYASGTSGIRYLVTDNVNWEITEGTFTTSPNQLSRDTILASSAGGAAINWSAGTKTVALAHTASEIVLLGGQPGIVTIGSTDNITKILATGRADFMDGANRFSISPNVDTDAYTLDQCIKGTWTPVLSRTGTAPVLTYSYQYGYFQKLGEFVSIEFHFNVNSITSQGSGAWYITGLPYSSVDPVGNHGGAVIGHQTLSNNPTSGILSTNRIYFIHNGQSDNTSALSTGAITGQATYRAE